MTLVTTGQAHVIILQMYIQNDLLEWHSQSGVILTLLWKNFILSLLGKLFSQCSVWFYLINQIWDSPKCQPLNLTFYSFEITE